MTNDLKARMDVVAEKWRGRDLAEMDESRDYLAEAFRIICGSSMLLAQKEHLLALSQHYIGVLERLERRIR